SITITSTQAHLPKHSTQLTLSMQKNPKTNLPILTAENANSNFDAWKEIMFISSRALPRPPGYNEPEFCHHLLKKIPQPTVTTVKGAVAAAAQAAGKTADAGAVANERAQVKEETEAAIGWITIEAAITQLIASHLDGRLLSEFNLAELTLMLEKFRQSDKESNLAYADRMYALSNLFIAIGASSACDDITAAKRFRQGLTPINATTHLISWMAAPKVSVDGVDVSITGHFPSLYLAIQSQVRDMRLSALQRGDPITDTNSMAMMATFFLVRPSTLPKPPVLNKNPPGAKPLTCPGCSLADCHFHLKYGTCPTCQTCLFRGHTAASCSPSKTAEARTKKIPQ
ncbi:hypothetical protein HDU67_004869, partial [Dinochytrium kinnereticum]